MRSAVDVRKTPVVRGEVRMAQTIPARSKNPTPRTGRRERAGRSDRGGLGWFTAQSRGRSGSTVSGSHNLHDSNARIARQAISPNDVILPGTGPLRLRESDTEQQVDGRCSVVLTEYLLVGQDDNED